MASTDGPPVGRYWASSATLTPAEVALAVPSRLPSCATRDTLAASASGTVGHRQVDDDVQQAGTVGLEST